jgi:hypothetical protein
MPLSNANSRPRTAAQGNGHLPWAAGPVLDVWAQFIDAHRAFWAVCTPWLPPSPWLWSNPAAAVEREEAGKEPARTVDGVPDALELQARTWNHLLDTQRRLWSAVALTPAVEVVAPLAPEDAGKAAKPRVPAPARKTRTARSRPR